MHRLRINVLMSLFAIIASVLLFSAGIWWMRSESSRRLTSILQSRQVLAESALELGQLDTLRRQQAAVSGTIEALTRAIPARGELVTLPAGIAALGEGLGVSSSATFGPEEVGTGGKPSSIELSIFSSGEFDKIRSFIAELEQATRPIIDIRGFDFSRSVDPKKFQGVIRGKIFFRP